MQFFQKMLSQIKRGISTLMQNQLFESKKLGRIVGVYQLGYVESSSEMP